MDSEKLGQKRLIETFIPTITEIIASVIFSFLFLVVINSFNFVRKIDLQYHQYVTDYIEHRFRESINFIDTTLPPSLLMMVVWAFVGMAAYVVLWLGLGMWHSWRTDNPVDGKRMVVPRNFNHSRALRSSIAHTFIRLLAGMLVLIWAGTFFTKILPHASASLIKAMSPLTLSGVPRLLQATLFVAGSWFVLTVLLRCCVLRVRVFS